MEKILQALKIFEEIIPIHTLISSILNLLVMLTSRIDVIKCVANVDR